MKIFKDKVAVVTGGASGIGRAIAERFGAEGMKLVLADIDQETLDKVVVEFKAKGVEAIGVKTDVTKLEQVESLAKHAVDVFCAAHIIVNNAGVGGAQGPVWDRSMADWEWVLGVNLWGVIHGIHTFVPLFLKQGGEGHVVNTASLAGLLSMPFGAPYHASKHAVVTISESLYYELALIQAQVKVSVLCPGFVNTPIMENSLKYIGKETKFTDAQLQFQEAYRQRLAAGLPAEAVAERVFEAVRDEKLYILTHPQYAPNILARATGITNEANPDVAADLSRMLSGE